MGKRIDGYSLNEKENRKLREEFSKQVSENIRRFRKLRNLTQEELAEAASLNVVYLGHLEAHRYHPSAFILWKISKALNIKIDELTIK